MSNGKNTRQATLQLSNASGNQKQVLTAHVPPDLSPDDFNAVGKSAFALIHRLTGCNCMSGRISFVVEDNFADVINVDLAAHGVTAGGQG